MEDIKFTVEKFFDDNHEIVDDFIDAVTFGEVRHFKYNVSKDGDCTFSFEMDGKKYVMDPEMDPVYAMKIIELFKIEAFTFINSKPEKLNSIIEFFKKDRTLKNLFNKFHFNVYDVETDKYVDDEDLMNSFVFTLYGDHFPDKQKSDDEIDEIIEKNGCVRLHFTYNDCYVEGYKSDFNKFTYRVLKYFDEEKFEIIREIVTETYFEEYTTDEELEDFELKNK